VYNWVYLPTVGNPGCVRSVITSQVGIPWVWRECDNLSGGYPLGMWEEEDSGEQSLPWVCGEKENSGEQPPPWVCGRGCEHSGE